MVASRLKISYSVKYPNAVKVVDVYILYKYSETEGNLKLYNNHISALALLYYYLN